MANVTKASLEAEVKRLRQKLDVSHERQVALMGELDELRFRSKAVQRALDAEAKLAKVEAERDDLKAGVESSEAKCEAMGVALFGAGVDFEEIIEECERCSGEPIGSPMRCPRCLKARDLAAHYYKADVAEVAA